MAVTAVVLVRTTGTGAVTGAAGALAATGLMSPTPRAAVSAPMPASARNGMTRVVMSEFLRRLRGELSG